MNFKGFYDSIVFDVDNSLIKVFKGKKGDTKSRGLFVTIVQKNVTIEDLADLSLMFIFEKPDKTSGIIIAVLDEDDDKKFRVDFSNQVFAVPGVVKAELRLLGPDEEVISTKQFKIMVDDSIADGSIVSENERGILDRAFELAEDLIPRIELLDVELLEDVQSRQQSLETEVGANASAISGIQDDLSSHLNDYAQYLDSEMGEEHIIRELPNGTKDELSDTGMLIKKTEDKNIDIAWFIKATTNNPAGFDLWRVNNLFFTRGLPSGSGTVNQQVGQLYIDGIPITWRAGWSLLNGVNQFSYDPALQNGVIDLVVPTGDLFDTHYGGKSIQLSYQLAEPIEIPLPNPMTPNTREIVRLSEQVDKLTSAIIALGGTII